MENKNAVATQQPKSIVADPKGAREEIVKQLEQMQAAKFISLPNDFKESIFFALEKLTTLEDIEKVPTMGITKAFLNVFRNKLDYRKNHCYFFVQNDKHSPSGKSLRFGWQYQGLVYVSKTQCGVVSSPLPVLVYENDTFETHYEYGALIIDKHIPTFEGKIKGGYCVVEFNGSMRLVRYYTKAQLDQRRDKSMKPKGNFWDWEREMYEKTLINATLKRIIETSEESDSSELYNEPDEKEHREVIDTEIIQQDEPKVQAEPVVEKILI